MSLSINVVPDLSEYSSTGVSIVKNCSGWTPENCPADTHNGRASQNNTCDVKDMNVELLSDGEPFEFIARKEAVSKSGIIINRVHARRFKVYYLNWLNDPNNEKKSFFKITWEEEEKEKEKEEITDGVPEETTDVVPEKTTRVKNYLIFTNVEIERAAAEAAEKAVAVKVSAVATSESGPGASAETTREPSVISMTIEEDRVIPCKSGEKKRKLTLNPPFTIPSSDKQENTTTEVLKSSILALIKSISVPPQILFYPQDLLLVQHDYDNNWSKLIKHSFTPSHYTNVPTDDSKVPLGKELIIVAGHQHSFRELLFPFQEISGNIFGTKEFRVGLRNGTCVMVGLFKDLPKGTLKDGEEYIRLVNGRDTFYLDMRVVFTESYNPSRDKDKYIYLDDGDSLLYTKKKKEEKERDCFRNDKGERTLLIASLNDLLNNFKSKSILLMRHGEAYHNLLDISKQLKKTGDSLDSYDQQTLNELKHEPKTFLEKKTKKWKNSNQILNSYLTPKGVYQARRIYYQYLKGILSQFKSVSYVCSSLDRTIETLINAVTGYTFSNGESSSSNPNITIGNQVKVTPGLTPETPGLTPEKPGLTPEKHDMIFTENPMSKILISNSTDQQSSQGIKDETSINFPGTIKSVDNGKKTCTVEYIPETEYTKFMKNVPFARIISSSPNDDIEKFKRKFDTIRSARGLIPNELKEILPEAIPPAASAGGKRTTSKTLKKRPTRRHNRRKLVSTSKKFLQKKRTRVKNYPLKKLKSVSRKK